MQTQSRLHDTIRDLKEVKDLFAAAAGARSESRQSQLFQQQVMLELTVRLQMSLDVDWVISQFVDMIHSYLMYDGYRFSVQSPDINLDQGRLKGHECTYNLGIEGEELGQLTFYRGKKFKESELLLLENFLSSLIYPLRNALRFKQASLSALHDSLTGVFNRSSFDDALTREMNLALRNEQSFSVMVVDIDHFKKVNDTYGHRSGDDVLKIVAERIQANIRNTDQLFRYGGEEFVVLLNNSDCEGAHVIADRILDSVKNQAIQINEESLFVTVSIGLSCLREKDTSRSLFERADSALYAAKNSGRNRVIVA